MWQPLWSKLKAKWQGPVQPDLTAQEQVRAAERHRRLLWSAVASALAKLISVGTGLVSVPLTLHFLGPERYGMWMTMTSLVAMLAFADLGMGNGLLNAVAAANGRDDVPQIRRYISSAAVVFALIALTLLLFFALVYPLVSWGKLFNVNTALASQEAGPAVAIFLTCFALSIPVGIVQRVQMALQMGYMSSLWQCAASVSGLLGVLWAIHVEASLPVLVGAFMGLPLVVGLVNALYFFGWVHPEIRPRQRDASRTAAREIFQVGLLFLVLQLVVAVAYSSDGFVIAQVLGPEAVVQHAVPDKMFSVVASVLSMMLAPLWPAYGEAIARGDTDWVQRTLMRSLKVAALAACLMSFLLVFMGESLLRLWVGHDLHVPPYLLVGLGVWKVLETTGNAVAAYLNGAHVVRAQVFIAITTAVAALSFKLWLLPRWGVQAVPWSTAAAYFLFAAVPYAVLVPRLLSAARRKAPVGLAGGHA